MKNKVLLAQLYAARAKRLLKKRRIDPQTIHHAYLLSKRALRIISKEDITDTRNHLVYMEILATHHNVLRKQKQAQRMRQYRKQIELAALLREQKRFP